MKRTVRLALLAGALAGTLPGMAQELKTWTGASGDFFDPTHWTGGVPGATAPTDIAVIDNGSTVTIAATAGTATFGTFRLAPTSGSAESGHVIMNGGTLILGSTEGDPKALIGNSATLSTFIMNGGTIMFDGPEMFPGSTSDDGLNGLDWEVGEQGIGRFEMHGNAVFRAGDDLKIAENAAGAGSCLIDGDARLSLGSGISISAGGTVQQTMVIGGRAIVDSGNSMGAGNPQGSTDEGYLTMATSEGNSKLTIQENGILNIRRLTARDGISHITVKDNGQFHIFDVLKGVGTSPATRPAEPGIGSDNNNSTYGSAATSDATLILQDNAVMTVSSASEAGPTRGLGISAQRGGGNPGGKAILSIRDNATFRVEQELMLGTGASAATSDGTLEIVGDHATVQIGTLNMAVDLEGNVAATDAEGNPAPGKATLCAVITEPSHSVVNVSGIARIGQGRLKVKLDGYTPVEGNTFTLIQGGTIEGQFAATDFTEAPLGGGLTWQVEYTANAVRLKVAGPRVITVTTANNANPPAGTVSLFQALSTVQAGDVIRFNIPGDGPHILATPVGGYPVITANNVIIDGYSQPGATPNTNPILAANNAKIKIVLDSRNGNARLMDFAPTGPTDQTGYGDTEAAVIGILSATGVQVRGVSILAVPVIEPETGVYGVAFAKGASGQVAGCWIGVHPDGTTIAGPADAITGFRYRVRDENNAVLNDILINDVIVGVAPKAANPRSEFNVIVGIPAIPIIIEGNATRISGNFMNVFPDGMNDFNPPLVNPDLFTGTFEGNIEIGRGGNNTVIGVDGDGVNDADERNIFSGVLPESLGGYDHNIEFYGQTPGTNIVIAGNYFGVAVNGNTRWTNGVPVLNAAGGSAQFRFGSDFDGVSDALEGNVAHNNYPNEMFQPAGSEGFFDELSIGAIVGARGNALINNFPYPVSPARSSGEGTFWAAYYAKALLDPAANPVPELSATTTLTRLVGKAAPGNTDYPTLIIDLYAADPEGIAYGSALGVPELPQGFLQGKAYIGSFVDNSAADANKTAGEFDFSLAGLELKGSLLTATANYVKGAAGTKNAITLTSPFSPTVEVTFAPGSIESVGLSRTVADTATIRPEADALGNWEPNISVLGTNVFLIEGNTFAEGSTAEQRYVVYLQPVDGSAGKLGEAFFADDGTPFRGQINLSRQNGNPGRVAGDKRPGARNFIAGGEVSLHGVPAGGPGAFGSDNRWSVNGIYDADHRYAAVQTFSLDAATLTQTLLSKGFDPVLGQNAGTFAGNVPEVSRFGGDVAGLDNGNFVVVIDDRSLLIAPRRTATAAIIAPDGTVVKAGFAIDETVENQIWSNVAAYQGGFCVRFNATLHFYDNAGNLKGKVAQSTSGLSYDPGRGDGTRIAAHINSPYVYLAGKVTTENTVKLAVWDARDMSFVGSADVSEGAFTGGFDRANLAVDALNRITVAWVSQPAGYEAQQVAARILAFNGATKAITALTKSFLPFANSAQTGGIRSLGMSVAMTTERICIAAKGEINYDNRPDQGVTSPREVNFFTVITHPDPQLDPTPPIGGGAAIQLAVAGATAASLSLEWTGGNGPFLLQRKGSLGDAAWMNVLTTSARTATVPNGGGNAFFRVQDNATSTVTPLNAALGGEFEKPAAVETPGKGVATLSLEGNTLSFDIVYWGLKQNANNAHIHGFVDTTLAAGVKVDLVPFHLGAMGMAGRIAGSVTVAEDVRQGLMAGDTYVNIHSGAHPGGEIRGQVTPSHLKVALNGANEKPTAVETPATGTGTVVLIGHEITLDVSYTGLKQAANNAHIHAPADSNTAAGVMLGINGMHVGAFGTAGQFKGSATLTTQQLGYIIDGLGYVNIHTGAHPGGEIRGQIVP